MKSKFNSIYSRYIVEQDEQPEVNFNPDSNTAQAEATPPVAPDIENQQPDQPQQLDTNGFVALVRLLKDAFVTRPKTADADKILEIGDINADNVYDKFKQISTLIKKYNPESDFDEDLGASV